jgi:hypothetical protein
MPIIALIGAFGYYLSNAERNKTESKFANVDGINRNELPTGQTIYSSNMVYEAEKQVYEKMRDNYIDSMNPSETNIIPPIYNTYNARNVDTNDKSTLNVNNNKLVAEYNNFQRLENIKKTGLLPEDNISTAPMFKDTTKRDSKVYKELESTLGGQEVSLLTGQVLDKRHNNMVPFFGGVVKQNMENFTNTTKLGLHTGETDTYFAKKEIASLYDKSKENIYGSATYTTQVETERFIPSYFRNNETPVEKEYISAPIAGTYDNNIRTVYRDTNELRVKNKPKLVYKGRNNHGQVASVRGLTGSVEKNNAETVWEWGEDRWNNTTGEYKGHQKYENYGDNFRYTNRVDTNLEYYGQVNPEPNVGEQVRIVSDRQKEGVGNLETVQQYAKRNQHIPGDNAYRNVNGGGNNSKNQVNDYGKAGYNDTTVQETQRETTFKTHVLNSNKEGSIPTAHYIDNANTTIKESTNHQPYENQGQISTDYNSGNVRAVELGVASYKVNTTQKELTVKNKYEQGIRHHDYGLGYATQNYRADVTNKEITTNKNIDYRGAAISESKSQKNRLDTDNAQIRTRQEQLLMNEKANGPQSFNTRSGKGVVNIKNNDNKLFSEMENTVNLNIDSKKTAPIKEFLGEFDNVKASSKSTIEQQQWSRLDSSIYEQLNENPFVNENMRSYNNKNVNKELEKTELKRRRFMNAPKTSFP